jgi:putative transposase
MIDRSHDLSIAKQAKALGISRGSIYYLPRPVPAADLAIMRRIDELHLAFPFAGSRMLRDLLKQEGIDIGRRHVSTLMKRMGIEALYRKPRTSNPTPGHKIYPYLLRGLTINRPNQVWAMDITYVPLARGFVYLAAVVDWFSRRVLSWRVSITLEAAFCVEALERLWPGMAGPRSSTPTRAHSSPASTSRACCSRPGSPSAWMAKAPGVTTSSLSGSGDRSSTRRCISGPTTRSARPGPRSADTWPSTMGGDPIRAWTGRRRTRPTSPGCRKPQQPETRQDST